jgi:hypothetical protein
MRNMKGAMPLIQRVSLNLNVSQKILSHVLRWLLRVFLIIGGVGLKKIYYADDNKKTTEPQIVTQLSQNPFKVFDCPMFQFSFGFDERLGKMQLAKKN